MFQERFDRQKKFRTFRKFSGESFGFWDDGGIFFQVAGNIQKNLSELPADHGAPDKPVRIQVLRARPLIQRNYSR